MSARLPWGTYRVAYVTPSGTRSTQVVHALSRAQALATVAGSTDAHVLAYGPQDDPRYVATITTPGQPHEPVDPPLFYSAGEAWRWLADQRIDDEDDWDDSDTYSATSDELVARIATDAPGVVTAPTPDHAIGMPIGLVYTVGTVE